MDKKLEDYESRKGKSRHIEVKVLCEQCGGEKWVRWIRIKKGRGRFCKLECANDFQKEEGKKTWGKENVRFHWNKAYKVWYAFWKDKETGKLTNTTKARFIWELNFGKILDKHVVTYIDGNSENCELSNLMVISRSESNAIRLIGHRVSDETKQKLSKVHTGKNLSKEHKLKISNSLRKRWGLGEFETVHVGKHHRKWKGGVEKVYPLEFNNALKERIKDRDRYKCRVCDKSNDRLEIHHIDGSRNNNEEENLIVTCVECHHLIHDNIKTNDPIILAFRSMI